MKKIILFALLAVIVAVSCKKDDILLFDVSDSGVVFPGEGDASIYKGYRSGDKTYYVSESFINIPFSQDKYIVDFPLRVSGDTSDRDRVVAFRIISDETTATELQYKIIESIIPKGKYYGYIRFELTRDAVLDSVTVSVMIELMDSKDLKVGSNEYKKGILSWNNMLKMFPVLSSYVRTYNMILLSPLAKLSTSIEYYSPNAHKAIIEALGWPISYWPKYSNGYPDPGTGTNTMFGAYYSDFYAKKLNSYLDAYAKANGGKRLKHNAGKAKGRDIQARVFGSVYIP